MTGGSQRSPLFQAPSRNHNTRFARNAFSPRRAAAAMPWDRQTARLYATIVPQMTLWLPDQEAAQWRLAFADQMERFVGSD